MNDQIEQYDQIGSEYDEYAQAATLKSAERYTFFRMIGSLKGQSVLDLACGVGYYTRLLKRYGAAQVLGTDVSPEMIRVANETEQAERLGIQYQVEDAASLPRLGAFDLVTAVHLLTYAASKEELLAMFQNTYANLVPGGRFITITNNPAFTLSKPNCTKYGLTVLRLEPKRDSYTCVTEFAADPPFRVQWNQWSQGPYEWALQEAGFKTFTWHSAEVSPEDVARLGEAYWHDFHDNCPIIGLICEK